MQFFRYATTFFQTETADCLKAEQMILIIVVLIAYVIASVIRLLLILSCLRLLVATLKAYLNVWSGSLVHVSSTSLYLFLSDFLLSMDRRNLRI